MRTKQGEKKKEKYERDQNVEREEPGEIYKGTK